ncbi:FecR domain-containing protein [Persephonella sp.]
MRIFKTIFILFLVATTSGFSQDAGKIVKFEGKVKVFRESSVRGINVDGSNFPLFVKDIIKTKSRSMAFIKFIDDSKIVLTEKSSLIIEDVDTVSAEGGRVLFSIKKRGGIRGLKVKARSVVIGVKGTKFIVDMSDDSMNIFLKEGLLSVRSLVGEFVRYKKKEISEFEKFKKEHIDEFEEYKKEMEEEFKEFVKEFEMREGTAVSITDGEVRDIKIPPEIEREFELLDEF